MISISNKVGHGFNESVLTEVASVATFKGRGHVQIYKDNQYFATLNQDNVEEQLTTPAAYKFITASGTTNVATVTIEDKEPPLRVTKAMVPQEVVDEIVEEFVTENALIEISAIEAHMVPDAVKAEIERDYQMENNLVRVDNEGRESKDIPDEKPPSLKEFEEGLEKNFPDSEIVVDPTAEITSKMQVNWGKKVLETSLKSFDGDRDKLVSSIINLPKFGNNRTTYTVLWEGDLLKVMFVDHLGKEQSVTVTAAGIAKQSSDSKENKSDAEDVLDFGAEQTD